MSTPDVAIALATQSVNAAAKHGHGGIVVVVVEAGRGGALARTSDLSTDDALGVLIDYVAQASSDLSGLGS